MKIILRYCGLGALVAGAALYFSNCDGDGPTGPEPVKSVWEWVPTPKCLAPVNDIYFVSANDGWAVAGNQIWHWDGLKWAVSTKFVSADPRNDIAIGSLWFNSSDDGWAGGAEVIPGNKLKSKLWHYDGRQWLEVTHPESKCINRLWFFQSNNGYAFTGDYVLRYDGVRWIKGGYYSGNLSYVFFWDENDGWATSMMGIWRWDGSTWYKVFDTSTKTFLHCIGFAAPNNGWALGEPAEPGQTNAWRCNGTEWQRSYAFRFANGGYLNFYDLQFTASDYGWAVGIGTWHWNGEKWTRYDMPWSPEHGKGFDCLCIFILSENDVWAGGGRGNIIHFKGFGNK